MAETEYRDISAKDGKYKVGLYVADTNVCLMVYDGYITGRNGDVMKLYPNRRGEGTMGVIKVPGKHSVSIYAIKSGKAVSR